MIKKGIRVRAKEDHYDEYHGDIFIARGDVFEVLDHGFREVQLRPVEQHKYPGEPVVRSREEMFHVCKD